MNPGDISPLTILIAAIFTNNILLSNYLGMCSFIALSRRLDTAVGMGLAVTFVSTFTTALNWVIYHRVLARGALSFLPGGLGDRIQLEIFALIVFIAVIAAFVQVVEMVLERFSPAMHQALGLFLPLITVNCAILGVALFMVNKPFGFADSLVFGFGSGLGWMLAIVLMAGIRTKIKEDKVPEGLRGAGLSLIVAGIIALAFVGFSGMIKM